MSTATRIQTVSFAVVQQVASRMFDPMQPTTGYFAFAGEQYRRLCKASAEENVIDETLAQARARYKVERRGMIEGVRDLDTARGVTTLRR